MKEKIEEKVFDVTGIELTPGKPTVCLGNGELGFECCCDESEFFLLCFPEFDVESKKMAKRKFSTIYDDKYYKNFWQIGLHKMLPLSKGAFYI